MADTKKKVSRSGTKASAAHVERPLGVNRTLGADPVVGDAQLRPGFSFTPELDRLFAVGFPHLALLTTEEVADEELGATAFGVFAKGRFDVEWPEKLARPLARLLPVQGGKAFVPGTEVLSDEGRAIFADQSDITEAEAQHLVGSMLGTYIPYRYLEKTAYLLEALMGSRATAIVANAIASLPQEKLVANEPEICKLVDRLPLMLLRAPVATRDDVLAMLERAFKTHAASPHVAKPSHLRPIDSLDVLLHGEEGRRRRFPNGVNVGYLPFVPVTLEEGLAAHRAVQKPPSTWSLAPDVRRVFVSGVESLDFENEWIAAYTKVDSRSPQIMLETYGLVNDVRTVDLMVRLSAKRPLVKAVLAWATLHAGLAKPELERIAAGGSDRAAAAKELLTKL